MRQILAEWPGQVMLLNGEDEDAHITLAARSISNYRARFEGVSLLALDEAQNIEDIGAKLKLIVDEVEGIRVLATGSSAFDLLNKAGEPLVGRSYNFYLYPFSQEELKSRENSLETLQNLETRLIYGSYPEVVLAGTNKERASYLKEVKNAYLLKDILILDGIRNSNKMQNLLTLIAYQVGQEVSLEKLGSELGLSKNTVEKYLDLLSKVFIIYRLGGFSHKLRKEVNRSGKYYFFDNGIRNAVINNFDPISLRSDTERGGLWENYLISERLKNTANRRLIRDYYFWRTYDGQEIDLIEEENREISAYEFKWGGKSPKIPGAFARAYPDAPYTVVNRENYLPWLLK
jgi:predicted AAA+ superfamily ATPase